jgi:hypothetical protein
MKIKLLVLGALFASLCASVQGQVIDKTPVLHFSFDNVSGTTVNNDGSGGPTLNGTLNGTATIVGGGKFGNCLSISGATAGAASVRVANAVVPLTVGNTWTLAMWIQTTTPGACYAYQGDAGWGPNNTSFYLNNGNGAGDYQGGVRYGTGWEEGTTAVDDGAWHHVVMVCNGTVKTLYLDGNVDPFPGAANAYNGDGWTTAGAGGQFWVGGNGYSGDGSANLNGLIDEVWFFNQALTPADIQLLYTNNTIRSVPVTVTVSPTNGFLGQVFKVTATATPVAGTVTNASVDLTALGLASGLKLVQASPNVFTNSFTVPTNAPFGADNVRATVIDTEPLVGSGGVAFTVVPRPPTNAIVITQITPKTVYAYDEVTFTFNTTNDAPSVGTFPMTYAWYKNNVLVSTNPMGPNYTFLTVPGDNNAQIYAIASVANTNYSSISVTSSVVTLTVTPGTPQYPGLKQEVFSGITSRTNVEIGNVPHGVIAVVTNADTGSAAGTFGDNTSRRYSGYFIPPTTDNYVFFVASDDDCDVFLSTDNTPANKRLIAQESGYSAPDDWQTPGGNGSVASQKRSDQWSPDGGTTVPYAAGIHLVGGQQYYFESVEHNGGGGDNWGVTYETETELTADPSQPADGSPSRMTAASNNIVFATFTGSTLAFASQPHAVTVYQGFSTNFTSSATNDAGLTPLYQWYLNTGGGYTAIAGATGPSATLTLIPTSYNGALIEVVVSNLLSSLSITSAPVAITVLQAVIETGFIKEQRWNNQTSLGPLENGSLTATANYTFAYPQFGASVDNPSGDNNFVRLISGYFIPPTTGNYKFYTTGDDDSDLFLSTDNTPAHKRVVCHQSGWNNGTLWAWDAVGGGGASASQMNSSTYSPDGGVTTPYSGGIPLIAGQQYYIEQDWHQGGGGANNAADFALISAPDPVAGTPSAFTGNVIAMTAVRCTYVAFTAQPASVTVPPQGYATFTAPGTTDGTTPIGTVLGLEENQGTNYLFYHWYKNGVLIPNANGSTLTLGPLQASDNSATIYCQMRALGYADNSLNPIWSNSMTATITIAPQSVYEPGLLQEDWWTNGTARSQVESGLLGSPNFTYTTPLFEGPSGLGTGNGPTINYVQRISGYFVPPVTQSYVFFTDSDDDSDLFVSTDATRANMRQVAQEAGWSPVRGWTEAGGGGSIASQKRSDQWSPDGGVTVPYSAGIPMNAGQMYYIEQVHHNGAAGGTHATATWKGINDPDPVIGTQTQFTNNLIGMYVPRIPWVAFLQQPTNATVLSGGNTVTFSVAGSNAPSTLFVGSNVNPLTFITKASGSMLQYQWYKNGVAIPGATAASYTQPTVLPSDQGAQFVCALRAYGYADNSLNRIYSNSVAAVLTVVTDTVPPTITSAISFVNTNWPTPLITVDVTFSKWMDATTLGNPANYSIAGATVTNVFVTSNHRTVELDLNQVPTLPVVVTVVGGKDLSGNPIASNSTKSITLDRLNFSDVGTPGTDPAYPSYVWIEGGGGYLVSAEGSDIWNSADGFNFGWELKTNDFDVVVRGVSNGHTSNYAKMGLMARETLDPGSRNWNIINDPASSDGIAAPDGSGYGANIVECNTSSTNCSPSVAWNQVPRTNNVAYPNSWLRLKRTGNTLSAFISTNGSSWLQLAYQDTSTNAAGPLSSVAMVGICTTAHNNDVAGLSSAGPFLYYNTAEYANYNSSYVAAGPQLSISVSGGNVIISWTPTGGHLQSSPTLSGPGVNWQTIGTANPATVSIGSGAQFFRVVNP